MKPVGDIAVRAVVAAVPKREARTDDYAYLTPDERARFRKTTGISARRIVKPGQCASDLCLTAAQAALAHVGWNRDSVGALVLVTQTGDQPVPATGIVLQDKLGLPQSCAAFDINLGCSSYPYGLAVIASMMHTLGIARSLLLIGDVSSVVCAEHDKSAWPLFGDAGSATALEFEAGAPAMHFDLMSDGSGKEAIIIPGGGLASKRPPGEGMRQEVGSDGVARRPDNLVLRGADIFSFAISKVPASIQRVMSASGKSASDVDYLVLHQANKMINDTIAKKAGFDRAKVPSSIERYGNTSSASIPVTLCANRELFGQQRSVIVSGFGVGLSWASATLHLPQGSVMPCIESDDVY